LACIMALHGGRHLDAALIPQAHQVLPRRHEHPECF